MGGRDQNNNTLYNVWKGTDLKAFVWEVTKLCLGGTENFIRCCMGGTDFVYGRIRIII